MNKEYQKLTKIFNKYYQFSNISGILNWDLASIMPKGGFSQRQKQITLIDTLQHELIGNKETISLSDDCSEQGLDKWQKANLREIRHIIKHQRSVPQKLQEELTHQGLECEFIWRDAKAENNFTKFALHLEKIVDLVKEIATIKSEQFNCSKYDALLDNYDPGRTSKEIDIIFSKLEIFLPNFLEQVLEKQKTSQIDLSQTEFPISKQKELVKIFMEELGFDFQRGRIDESVHPFCGGYTNDVRITTKYNEDNFLEGLMGVIHETGHALYENNLPQKYLNQPVGQALGMSIHESQSLFLEMQIARSKEFMAFALPIIKHRFNINDSNWNVENLYLHFNHVQKTPIRIHADEVTYPLHVILRYNIEKKLINGDITVYDLPDIWNKYMQQYLGFTPEDHAHGCMQDIHWTDGSFGYFPNYTLGAIHAAQIAHKMYEIHPEIKQEISKGNFKKATNFTKENIHKYGSLFTADELIKKATGEALNCDYFIEYLQKKFLH